MRYFLPLLLLAAAPSPVPVPDEGELRMARIGYQIAISNRALCAQNLGWWSGMLLSSIGQWPLPERATVMAERGMQNGLPTVMNVFAGSAADKAGVRAGDGIVSAGSQHFKETHPRQASFAEMALLETALETKQLDLVVRRGGQDMRLILQPDSGCASRLSLRQSSKMNAAADGQYAEITTAIMAYTANDDELAFLVGHEMAHNVLRHAELLDRLGKKVARVRETEIAADKMAVQFMHGGGFDPFAAARFWTRFGKRNPFGFLAAPTHLRTGKRVAMLEEEARRVTAR